MTPQNEAQERRNCPAATLTAQNLLDALCEAISRRRSHSGGRPMLEVLQVIFIFGFGLVIGWGLGRNTR